MLSVCHSTMQHMTCHCRIKSKGGEWDKMGKGKVIDKVNMYCPICGKTHDVEKRIRKASMVIKEDIVDYQECYFFCEYGDDEENEFVTGGMMNSNLMNARNVYRVMHGLLTSDEIVAIRELYGLSQVDLAKLMGWGEATVSRYESKAIQDESYDIMLRFVRDNPLKALELLEHNKASFSDEKYAGIKIRMKEQLQSYGKEFLSQQALKSVYVDYMEPSVWNGNTVLNVPKIEVIISYFASAVVNPLKTKMMKLLWYADVLSYKKRGAAMTGLVYAHEHYGALPLGHNVLVNLENLKVEEEYSLNYDTVLRFYSADEADYSILDKEELKILKETADKFKTYSAKEIVDYMHKESAYMKTRQGDLIPFDLAGDIREF